MNVFQTFRFVHIQQYREEKYPLSGVYYHLDHIDDIGKLLEKREGDINAWNYFCETIIELRYR